MASNDQQPPSVPVSEEGQQLEHEKLFLGNLPLQCKESDIKAFFEDVAPVAQVDLHNHKSRSKSRSHKFAFVTFASPADADTALEKSQERKLLDREIRLSKARTQSSKPRQTNAVNGDGNSSRPVRGPRRKGPPEDAVESPDSVFVANLGIETDNKKFEEIFSGYQISSANVVLRPIPGYLIKKLEARGEKRHSRGFGFIKFENHEEQQRAINEMNGKTVDGREIVVKVAMDKPQRAEGSQDETVEAAASTTA